MNPKHVAVTFVDNSTGQALSGCSNPGCVFPLTGPTSSVTLNDWSGAATIQVPAAGTNIGVRVSIGAQNGSCAGVNATSTYTCYDYSTSGQPSKRGVVTIRSYSIASVSGTPILRSVTPGSCSGQPYFSTYQATAGTCTAGVTAVVDFPSGATQQRLMDKITQGNCNNPSDQMTRSGTTWTPTLIVNFGGPIAEDYFYDHEDVHSNAKLRRFTPHFIIDAGAWRLSEPFQRNYMADRFSFL